MSRILALDYGTKRIGAAISDPLGIIATPLPFFEAEPFPKFAAALKNLVQEKDVRLILVGMPRNMDGTFGPAAEAARQWIEKLKPSLNTPIQTVDERLSTVQASRLLREAGHDAKKQKSKVDSAAAQILLQQFLSSDTMQANQNCSDSCGEDFL
ncbi:MAG: Holliday junction resolvase RuvX [bacterium]